MNRLRYIFSASLCLAMATACYGTPGVAIFQYEGSADVGPGLTLIELIPSQYLLTGGYQFKLSGTEMQIDHIASNSRSTMKNRLCAISISYTQPVMEGQFSSRFDLPLLTSDKMRLTQWTPATPKDYTILLSDTVLYNPTLKLLASARFQGLKSPLILRTV